MKHGTGRKAHIAEGWLLAASVGLVLTLSLGIWLNRQPRNVSVAPVHFVQEDVLERAVQVQINLADVRELMQLPGIGEVLAARIVEDRELNGPYECIEDLLRVKGIGEAKLEELRPYARVE